jgi:hypothetical protein
MGNRRTLLLIDDDPAHAKVFREALVDASDGPFGVNGLGHLPRASYAWRRKGFGQFF